MATISFSEAAPTDAGKVHFAFGQASFDLDTGGTLDSTDQALLANAAAHPWLKVTYSETSHDESEKQADAVAASADPHVNPKADHLSSEADPAVVEAADKRAAEIRNYAQPNTEVLAEPATTQDTEAAPAAAQPATTAPTLPTTAPPLPDSQEHTA